MHPGFTPLIGAPPAMTGRGYYYETLVKGRKSCNCPKITSSAYKKTSKPLKTPQKADII